MTRIEVGCWTLAAAASLWASAWAWRGPTPRPAPEEPPALPRPPTEAEAAALRGMLVTLRADLAEARARLGQPPRAEDLEGAAPDGRPVLAHGLPDNPLVPGVAGVVVACPPQANGADWIYCPETGALEPGEP